ncbi:MAG: hypothetical protein UHC59_03120 [Fibrobacteraceae bacterium]|nr:hypothetical protein [Fibrobacteraceae bacterium]
MEKLPPPTINNELHYRNFTLVIKSYRKMSEQEIKNVAREIMIQKNWKTLPTKGTLVVHSLIGAFEE